MNQRPRRTEEIDEVLWAMGDWATNNLCDLKNLEQGN